MQSTRKSTRIIRRHPDSHRTWITRDEIAEIYEARSARILDAISSDRMTVLDELQATAKVLHLHLQASGMRAIEALNNPVGQRVR